MKKICPVCGKSFDNLTIHINKIECEEHKTFLKNFYIEFYKKIDPLLENEMQIEILSKFKNEYSFFTENFLAKKIRNRIKKLNLNPRKALGKKREGKKNPVFNEGVRERISNSVTKKWEDGAYIERINGMLGKTGEKSTRYDEKCHNIKNVGIKYFNSFLKNFQAIDICNSCGCDDKKINIHHVDENHENFLPSNLEPLCVTCHMRYHRKNQKQPFITIGKEFSFAGAHQLPNHKGLCKFLHGHEWKLRITIKKRINYTTGMVMDFSDLKNIVNKYIIGKLDHSLLNDILYNPTAENLLIWIWEQLMFKGLLKGLHSIDLWESSDSIATITYKDMISIFEYKHSDKKF